jgi:hypothetical protein
MCITSSCIVHPHACIPKQDTKLPVLLIASVALDNLVAVVMETLGRPEHQEVGCSNPSTEATHMRRVCIRGDWLIS